MEEREKYVTEIVLLFVVSLISIMLKTLEKQEAYLGPRSPVSRSAAPDKPSYPGNSISYSGGKEWNFGLYLRKLRSAPKSRANRIILNRGGKAEKSKLYKLPVLTNVFQFSDTACKALYLAGDRRALFPLGEIDIMLSARMGYENSCTTISQYRYAKNMEGNLHWSFLSDLFGDARGESKQELQKVTTKRLGKKGRSERWKQWPGN
ncbi:hypothetical protein L873DRAFT_1380200 [Choiromyces venosus 120613-1]|uniref:Uncharacterized protein n=1 Tax=Choiromyces venosus 120613-1 TaxID=1336337 RepID=A0A3N4JE35_9PEZI|nr:hypothetical protein L873DRAFT_1380200 [Choiromyces venosus 120613-1]